MSSLLKQDSQEYLIKQEKGKENRNRLTLEWSADELECSRTAVDMLHLKKKWILDMDVVIMICDANGQLIETVDPQLRNYHDAIRYLQDGNTVSGDAKEVLSLMPDKIPSYVDHLLLAGYLYDSDYREQSLRMLQDLHFTITGCGRSENWTKVITEEESASQGIVIGEFYRCGAIWAFQPDGRALLHAAGKQAVIRELLLPETGDGRKDSTALAVGRIA